jgi:preprotein translocase subunit YajC
MEMGTMQEFALLAMVMLLGLGAYWAMVLYPKQRTFQKRQKYVRELAEGDEIITYGGIIGKVVRIEADEGIAHLEIADGIVIRIIMAAMIQPYDPAQIALAAQGEPDSPPSAE